MADSTYKAKESEVEYLGKGYRRCKMRLDLANIAGVKESNKVYDADYQYVSTIDRALMECSRTSRQIITECYLKNNDPKWYLEYWCRTTYYRKKRLAIDEFLRCLNI